VGSLREKLKIPSDALPPPETAPPPQEFPQRVNPSGVDLDHVVKIHETNLAYLRTLNRNALRNVLPTVSEDRMLPALLDKLNAAEWQYADLTNSYSSTDTNVIQIQKQISMLNKQVDDRVKVIIAELENRLKKEGAKLETTRVQPYWDEQRELARRVDFHKLLAAKIESEKSLLSSTSPYSMVVITDAALPPALPVARDYSLGVSLFVIGLFPAVGGFLLLKPSRRQFT
jgi:hypothetical protein